MKFPLKNQPTDWQGIGPFALRQFPRLALASSAYRLHFDNLDAIKIFATASTCAGKSSSVFDMWNSAGQKFAHDVPPVRDLETCVSNTPNCLIHDHADSVILSALEPGTYSHLSNSELSFCLLAQPQATASIFSNAVFQESRLFDACLFAHAAEPVPPDFLEQGTAMRQIGWVATTADKSAVRRSVTLPQEAADKLSDCVRWLTSKCPGTRTQALECNVCNLAKLFACHQAVTAAGATDVEPVVAATNIQAAASIVWFSEQQKQSLKS